MQPESPASTPFQCLAVLNYKLIEAHPTAVFGARVEQHNPGRRKRQSGAQSCHEAPVEQLCCDELVRRARQYELTGLANRLCAPASALPPFACDGWWILCADFCATWMASHLRDHEM